MAALLTDALRELQARHVLPAHAPEEHIVRVDSRRAGELSLEVQLNGKTSWHTLQAGRLFERDPLEDDRLPMVRTLDERNTVLAYRPGRRIVTTGSHDGDAAIFKGFKRRRSAPSAHRHTLAGRAAGDAGFKVPRLMAHDPQHEKLVFERLTGQPISIDLAACDIFVEIGERLAAFQRFDAARDLDHHSGEDEIALLQTLASRVQLATGELPPKWVALLTDAERALAGLDRPPSALCHRDLHDGQFLLVQSGIALLDHDLLCTADAALDPANLLAHITLRSLQEHCGADAASAHACGEAFLEGLGIHGDLGFWRRLRMYQAFSFLRLSLLYSMRPRWRSLAPVLLQLAGRCLPGSRSVSGQP